MHGFESMIGGSQLYVAARVVHINASLVLVCGLYAINLPAPKLRV